VAKVLPFSVPSFQSYFQKDLFNFCIDLNSEEFLLEPYKLAVDGSKDALATGAAHSMIFY